MLSGGFHPLIPPGDPGPGNRRDGVYTGRSFPSWGDKTGDYGELTVLRMESTQNELPKQPFIIRKSVEAYLGVKITDAFPEKRGVSYLIHLRNKKHVEKLLKMNKLSNDAPIRIVEHPTKNSTRCVVSCEESVQFTTDVLLEELQDQGVTAMRRITRKVEGKDVPTPTIILTIKGTVIPQSVNFGWIKARTRPYYPTPMLCYACFEYGHPRARCPSKDPVCGVCCGKHISNVDNPCHETPYCKHCRTNDHPVASKKCPIYLMEVDIQHIMVDQGIGYPGARRIWESQHRQKTAATVVSASNDQRFAELNAKFDQLLNETAKKDRKLNVLMEKIDQKDEQIRQLISGSDKKDQMIAEKEARIAALEAALAAANIEIPAQVAASETESITIPETPPSRSTKPTGAIKKQPSNERKSETSARKSRSRSRSSRRSARKHSKDRLSVKRTSNPSINPTCGSTKSAKKTTITDKHGRKICISDDEDSVSVTQDKTETESDMDFAMSPDGVQSLESMAEFH